MEPQFIAQTADVSTTEDALRRAWIAARVKEAHSYGMKHTRTSWTQRGGKLVIIVEAWKTRPADEGVPRFGVAA